MTKAFLRQHRNRVAKNTAERCKCEKYDKKGDGSKRIIMNRYGQALRDPEEFNPHSEGYTPFGDE